MKTKKTKPKKITINFIKEQFKKEKYTCLSNEYITAHTKLNFICNKGHYGQITWSSFQQGHRCKQCFIDRCKIIPLNWKGGVTKSKLPLFNTFAHQISWIEEVRYDPENSDLLQVRCIKCNNWFTPNRMQIDGRILSLNSKNSGERHFYCSTECKNSCSIFNRSKYPKGFKIDRSREVQPELASMVLERDCYECQRCGNKDDLECHHYEGIEQNPIESADIDACVTLCSDCHDLAHKDKGCRRIDLTKKELCK